jgi:enoyl-CoA hydratase
MISLEIDPRAIARLTIDNQRKLNVLDRAHLRDFAHVVEEIARDETLRAVILSGAGGDAFSGGADIEEMSRLDQAAARESITLLHRCCEGLRKLPFPSVAVICGYALGAGLEIAASCDLRIAVETARFGMPEVRVGIPSVIEAALLPGLIGWGRARRLLLLGEIHSAREAESWGLVDQVVAPHDLGEAVDKIVDSILSTGPNAIRLQKKLMRGWEELPLAAAIEAGIDSFAQAFETDEPRRMMQAFLNRGKKRD